MLQRTFALVVSLVLIAKGLLGFLLRGGMFGLFSTTMNHNFFYTIAGAFYLWVGVWGKEHVATGWNRFLGWTFLIIGGLGVLDVSWLNSWLGVNTPGDDLFNIVIALVSLGVAYIYGKDVGPFSKRR
ncbi:MAG: hypothetical protein OXR66_08925 [Candidatus Woesearchaeota archaeon]|nr:hypothetical protein [Candidatus Woesearchaeota archaeon]